ncbi:MAG: hypothetical protein ACLPUT_00250 [Solirubrobacteraceae bacterium]
MPILGPLDPSQLFRTARGAVLGAARRLRPDHHTIAIRSVQFYPTGMRRFYLYAAVAPSRSAARAFDERAVRRAGAFAADAFAGVFDTTPSITDQDTTLFTVRGDDGADERALYVHRSGLVELLWALTVEQPEGAGEELALDASEIAAVLTRVAGAVGRRPYSELSRAGRGPRRLARVDWAVNLASYVSTADGERAWSALRFADATPLRAQHQQPAARPGGFGAQRLRNRRRKLAPIKVARVVLGELAAANGYYEFTSAVEQTLARAAALPELPPPGPALAAAGSEPSEGQRRVLDAVYERFRASGRQVPFSELDKQFDLQGIALRPLAESMPRGLLLPVVASRGGFYRDSDELMVTREGLRYCEQGAEALDLLARGLAYLAKREKPFIPSESQRELQVTSTEAASALHLTESELRQLLLMLHEYEHHVYQRSSWSDDTGAWEIVVACRYVRRFRGIRDGRQYLRAREGESFAHQLDAEEAIPRFALIGQQPSSLALDSEPVVMRVENHGPTETFEATVEEITCAQRPPTPWHVRWRGVAEHSKEIPTGGHWVLEIARDDALHGADKGSLTPGFVFFQPDRGEVFVANTLGSGDSRYGLPMRVKIRVTPRSDPQRSLENVVTLQITMQGRQVRWDRLQVTHE